MRADDALVAIVTALFERAEEHQVHPHGIGAVLLDQRIRHDDVAAALRHLRAFIDDQTVRAELRERLFEVDEAEILQRHRDEARIHQVQHGVLVAADVRVHRQPLARDVGIEGDVVAIGCSDNAGNTTRCRGTYRRRRSRGAPGPPHTGQVVSYHSRTRASGLMPESSGLKSSTRGRTTGKIRFRHRHGAMCLAINDRDRRTPVALPRYAPIVQPVVDLRFADAALGQPFDDGALAVGDGHTVEAARVDQRAVAGIGLRQAAWLQFRRRRR